LTTDSGTTNTASTLTVAPSPVVTQIVVGQPAQRDAVGSWNRQEYPSPVDGSPLCAIVSIPVVVQNGELETQVSIVVSNSAVYLRTDAAFDAQVPETGYRIDAGLPVPFDRFHNELTAVVDDNYFSLLSSIKKGATLSVSFAYDPQLSSSNTHVVELNLDSFNQVWSENVQCNTQNDG